LGLARVVAKADRQDPLGRGVENKEVGHPVVLHFLRGAALHGENPRWQARQGIGF